MQYSALIAEYYRSTPLNPASHEQSSDEVSRYPTQTAMRERIGWGNTKFPAGFFAGKLATASR